MPDTKLPRSSLTVAPEFTKLGRLASILKRPSGGATGEPVAAAPGGDVWTVFGIGAIWQTAAENAARLANVDLGAWVSEAIHDAANTQGVVVIGD